MTTYKLLMEMTAEKDRLKASNAELLIALKLAGATIDRLTCMDPNKRASVQGTLDVSRGAIARAQNGS